MGLPWAGIVVVVVVLGGRRCIEERLVGTLPQSTNPDLPLTIMLAAKAVNVV